jgi:DNA-binding GntR family transcriptional regulator
MPMGAAVAAQFESEGTLPVQSPAAQAPTPATPAVVTPTVVTPPPKVRRRSISADVADHIRSRIFDGTLKPNQRVPQDAIAADLGVSRVPVREALISLEQNGLVVSEPNRGMFVVPIRHEDIDDHYRMYGMIQGLAATRAVRRMTEPVLTRLRQLHDEMCAGDDPHLLRELNYEFHSLINRTGGSTRVRSVLRHLSHNLPRELYYLVPGGGPQANAGHAKILQALQDGDEAAADAANQEHVRLEGDLIIAALKRNGILTD